MVVSACGNAPICEVAAASSLRPLLSEMIDGLEPPLCDEVALVTGSSTQLGQQVDHGARFDLLLTADEVTVDRLVAVGHATPANRFTFAEGALVLWTRDDLGWTDVEAAIAALRTSPCRIAIADPDLAPYGRAAMEALRRLDPELTLQPRLVFGENAGQAAHFAATGAAQAALLPRSLCIRGPLQKQGHRLDIDRNLHAPIRHEGVVLAEPGAGRTAALAVRDLLLADSGRAMLLHHGFEVPR